MKNVTNGINNVGKISTERDYDLRFTGAELLMFYNIVGNSVTHQNYPGTEELEKFINDFQEMVRAAGVVLPPIN